MSELAAIIAGVVDLANLTVTAHGVTRTYNVQYREAQAYGDNGRPVPGDHTGTFELSHGGTLLASEHVSPHGTSGYGNPHAKPYAAGLIAEALLRHLGRERAHHVDA